MDSEVKALILKKIELRYQAYMDSLSARASLAGGHFPGYHAILSKLPFIRQSSLVLVERLAHSVNFEWLKKRVANSGVGPLRLLDVGCGISPFYIAWSTVLEVCFNRECLFVGVDSDEDAIKIARDFYHPDILEKKVAFVQRYFMNDECLRELKERYFHLILFHHPYCFNHDEYRLNQSAAFISVLQRLGEWVSPTAATFFCFYTPEDYDATVAVLKSLAKRPADILSIEEILAGRCGQGSVNSCFFKKNLKVKDAGEMNEVRYRLMPIMMVLPATEEWMDRNHRRDDDFFRWIVVPLCMIVLALSVYHYDDMTRSLQTLGAGS